MCGENLVDDYETRVWCGSPPRVRGKPFGTNPERRPTRLTPACAGKTISKSEEVKVYWAHPRVCGENRPRGPARAARSGSPPRVRGKPPRITHSAPQFGLTPACAGKTPCPHTHRGTGEAHPRVCGGNWSHVVMLLMFVGSPPRVRGKPRSGADMSGAHRLTPACAGKTGGS